MRVLVAYGSVSRSTARIAERLGKRLRHVVSTVDVCSVGDHINIGHYDAVVIGCDAMERPCASKAARFVRQRASELAGKPVWLFSVVDPFSAHVEMLGDEIADALTQKSVRSRGFSAVRSAFSTASTSISS